MVIDHHDTQDVRSDACQDQYETKHSVHRKLPRNCGWLHRVRVANEAKAAEFVCELRCNAQ